MTSSGPSPNCGSPACTVAQTRSQSSRMCSRMNSVASSIAPSLKYCPNEKLPSISKNVRCDPSRPTSSMSGVRKHFCTVTVSGAGGSSRPRKYGIWGCIPAVVRSVEWSSARGTSDADGTRRWPLPSKNAWKPSRSSAVDRITRFYEQARSALTRRPMVAAVPRRIRALRGGDPRRARSAAVLTLPSRRSPPRPCRAERGKRRTRARSPRRGR